MKRKFDELISYFNLKVSKMDIDRKYKMELLGMITAIGLAHEKEMSHWISCKERLPDKDDEYFVTVDPRHIPPGYRSTDKFIWHDGKWVIADYFVMDDDWHKKPEYRVIEVDIPVLAWMPLPEAYREGVV